MPAMLLLALVGCANGKRAAEYPAFNPPALSAGGEVPLSDRWWVSFGDAALNTQVEIALQNNFTLAAALQRLNAARALTRREASDLFPDLNAVGDLGYVFGPQEDVQAIAWGLDTAYQVDLWGQIESRVEAERLRASATAEDYQAVALTLAAEVARTWFGLIEAYAQLELLDEQLETNRRGLQAQELRFGLGFIRSADVFRQRQLVQSTLEQAVVVRSRIELLEHQLAVLQGQMPQSAQYDPGSTLPALPPLPATGLPCELLNRRPDVRRDYLAFLAADQDLASAITSQYPRLNLSGSLLNATENPSDLFRDWFTSVGGQLISPLFDGRQRRSEVERTSSVTRQRFNEYGETVLNAFREVEDNLARERYQLERLERLDAQVELAQRAAERLREQYLIGEADYLDVLSAVQAQQRLQRETLAARLDLVLIRIALYLALAGSFDVNPQFVGTLPAAELQAEVPEELPAPQPDPSPQPDPALQPDSTGVLEASPIVPEDLPSELEGVPTVPEDVFTVPARIAPEINLNE